MAFGIPPGSKTEGAFAEHYPKRHVRANAPRPLVTVLRATALTLAAVLSYLILWTTSFDLSYHSARSTRSAKPEDSWRDEDWPYHEQEPWDISTDFAYPRTLEYEVLKLQLLSVVATHFQCA